MNNTIPDTLFSEKQRFRQWWLWTLIIGLNAITLGIILTQIIGGEPVGNRPAGILFHALNFAIIMGTTLLFLSFRLETMITREAIQVRFFPFHRKYKIYSWDMIRKAYTREYRPMTEYGGWGIRGFGGNRALNVSGKHGLQLDFTDGKKLLIGTQKAAEIELVLKKLGKLKS